MTAVSAFDKDFTEFMALAERGNLATVSTTVEQCQQELNERSYFDHFPPQAIVHAFGNVLKPDYQGSLRFNLWGWFNFDKIW